MAPKVPSARTNRNLSWVPPPSHLIKFNCDGAFNPSRSFAAFGVIARVSGGSAHCWRVGRVPASSAIHIEAWALRIACATAMEMELSEAIFESDCLELVNAVTDSKNSGAWEISTLIEDIKEWAKVRCWSFVWCVREQNKAAHCLADLCLRKNLVYHSGCISPEVGILLGKRCNWMIWF